MEQNTQEEISIQKSQPKKLTKAGLISIIVSSALVLVAIVTTLVLCLRERIVFVHIDDSTIEYSIKPNSTFSEPTDLPLAEGEIILGYYTDEDYTSEFDFDAKIKNNTHIYVNTKQLPKQTITFSLNIDNQDAYQTVYKYENTKLELPDLSDYERAGYEWKGWAKYYNGNYEHDLQEGDKLYFKGEQNIDLYAVWTPVKYKIILDTSVAYTAIGADGKTIAVEKDAEPITYLTYTIDDEITLPTAEKDNAILFGWTITQENSPSNWPEFINNNSLALSKGYYGDITIQLRYEANAVRILFEVDDERKALFEGTDYEYLVSPQSEADYVYGIKNQCFNMAFKIVDGEKYYVFKEDPTDSSSSYVAPYITGMGISNRYWQGLNKNKVNITPINAKGSTNMKDYNINDNCVSLSPIWATQTINLKFVDPTTGKVENPDGTSSEAAKEKYGLSDDKTSVEYWKTYTNFLPILVDSETNREFDGWYTEETGGEKIESYKWDDLSITKKVVYARWK